MIGYSDMSTKPQRGNWMPGIWTLIFAMLLFVLTLTGVAWLKVGRAQSHAEDQRGEVFLVSRLWTHFGAATNASNDEVPATVERIARNAINSSSNYYEEQSAVVVNEERAQPILAQRQDTFGPPDSGSDSYGPPAYYDGADDYGSSQQSAEEPYAGSDEQVPDEARAAQGHPYDSYYSQWHYAPKTPAPPAINSNRKMQPANRPPYPAYEDEVYDYPMGFQPRPHEQEMPKQAATAPPVHAVAHVPPIPTESTLVTFLKSLKQMWDLYQALMSAWNTVADRHQQSSEQLKKERMEKLRQQQQQQQQQKTRVNSKKPQRLDGDKSPARTQTKKAKTTTTTTTSTTASNSDDSEEATTVQATVEPSKRAKGDDAESSSVRGLRQKREPEPSTDVGEGRYIKGDPLKGYYDFVITEGSYKFWAAFQVGTAVLIIYSTFAAIYYSKVNPLTSDYDYQDYLGAGRSLSGGDDDFVDDSDAPMTTTSSSSRLMDWIPRTAHSLKFILDAIDKIPIDHDQKSEKGWSTGTESEGVTGDSI